MNILKAIVFTLLILGGQPSDMLGAESVDLAVGESREIDLGEFADSVSLSRDGIVNVNRGQSKSILIMTGARAGSADVNVKLSSGKSRSYGVQVSDPTVQRQKLETIRSIISAISGLSAEVKGGLVRVSGKVRTHGSLERFTALKERYSGLIVDTTERDIPPTNAVLTTINRVLSENGIPNIQARSYGKIITLEGTAKSESERELALRIAKMIQSDIEDRIEKDSSAASSVRIEVMFVEVQKKDAKKFGLNGAFGLPGQVIPGGTQVSAAARASGFGGSNGRMNWLIGDFSAFLEMVQNTSSSRVLSNPQLISRSGQEAKFHSGGIFYVQVSTTDEKTTKIELKELKYGIELGVLPKIDSLGQIDAKISTVVSDLQAPKYESALPTKTISELSTAVSIRDGQSILLSGLINKKQRKTVDRVPLLADIPIIGELFKRRTMDMEEAELLILVTMNRVGGSDGLSPAAEKLWEKGAQDTEFSIFD